MEPSAPSHDGPAAAAAPASAVAAAADVAESESSLDASGRGSMASPPPIHNYFQSSPPNGDLNYGGLGGGSINVDNIFASLTEDNGVNDGAGINSNGGGSDGGIFRNFAAVSGGGQAPQQAAVPLTIPVRKYSDNTNNFSGSRVIEANNAMNPKVVMAGGTAKDDSTLGGTGGEGLSKSVGNAAFLRAASSGRNMSMTESDTTPAIRHAGYLLKRSNLPFTSVPVDVKAAVGTDTVAGIALLPDLSDVGSHYDGLFTLPFGGSDRAEGGESRAMEEISVSAGNRGAHAGPMLQSPSKSGAFHPTIDPTSTASMSTDDTADEPIVSAAREECFCSPIVQYFQSLFQRKQPIAAPDATTAVGNNTGEKTSPTKRRGSQSRVPKSPEPTRPMPIAPQVADYIMPLKAPARSEPLPISSPQTDKKKVNVASILRRGSATEGKGGKAATNSGVAPPPKKKAYPPPPPDYVDPKDGHIWRAKYCVLEEGILYFYRTAEEGESEEAETERYESRLYDEEGEDIVLGEEVEIRTSLTSSPRATFAVKPSFGSGRTLSMEDRQSSRDLRDLSKSPMPLKKSYMLEHFNASPFHRMGSSVLTGASGEGGDGKADGWKPTLNHSSSMGTFNHDADILWEKRVALDCVGAVRSSEQEHGAHAFELLAYGSDERGDESDVSTRDSSGTGGQKQEIIDRLIMRAGGSDDMNAWMFQFHRSLASFMQQFVNSVRSAEDNSLPRAHHRRLPTPIHGAFGKGGSTLSPLLTKQSFATSPTAAGGGSNSFHESFSPNIVGSLSHGHGRNALYRRQVRDGKSNEVKPSPSISPLPTPTGTPLGGSSPVDAVPGRRPIGKKELLLPIEMVQGDASKIQNKVGLQSLRDLREREDKNESDATAAAPSPKKYIPPHMRRKLAAAKEPGGDSDGAEAKKSTPEKRVPLNYGKRVESKQSSDALDELSDSVLSAGSTSSLLSRQLEEEEASIFINVRLGGCADPTVVVGSIVDHHYIDRKASVVGNARLEAFGGTGGGHYASFDRHHCRSSDEVTLDDLDVDAMDGSRSRTGNANGRRSVLKWEVGASSECGVRNSNEDSYVVINNLDNLIQSQGLISFSDQDVGKTSQQGLYAIFDGHVGNQAARYAAEKFPSILMEEQSSLASMDSACQSSIEERADIVLREAFDRLDKGFCQLCTKDGRDWDCGSTALVALIVDDVVTLANLGDCRGVVCRLVSSELKDKAEQDDGWEELDPDDHREEVWDRAGGGDGSPKGKLFWKEVTETHSPLADVERARIEEARGWIIEETEIPIGQLHRMDIFDKDVVEIVRRCFADRMKQHRSDPVRQIQIARTCGDLAVSRAIGDRDFKAAYNMPSTGALARSWEGPPVFIYPEGHSGRFKGDIVSNVPDISFFKVGQEGVLDEFLLMACDGLWDVMDGDDAVRVAKDLLFDKKLSAKDGAARLAELAQHLGSSDNITVILIRFYWAEESKEE
ncbi:hypothetical protein ACHAXT_009046 [Thalassiosira profunda]